MKSRDRYKEAGVDVEQADRLIARHFGTGINAGDSSRIQGNLIAGDANFGALATGTWARVAFPDESSHDRSLDAMHAPTWRMVMTSDGVGSKVLLATKPWHHRAIAQDCVAMCLNDLHAMGASPMWFMDYFSSNTLQEEVFAQVARGLLEATQREGCLLMGGETSEMPGFYAHDHYELVGFAVGRVRTGEAWTHEVRPGDWVIALPSDGLHSNGFSLVRHWLAEQEGGEKRFLEEELEGGQTLRDHLMQPTRLYGEALKSLLDVGQERFGRALVRRAAHVTGGGLVRARQRLCGMEALSVEVFDAGEEPLVCRHMRGAMRMNREEAEAVWNGGVGFLLAISGEESGSREAVRAWLANSGVPCWLYGRVVQAA